MPRALSMAMLILPPAMAILGGATFIALAIKFRKSFGTIHDLPPGAKAAIAMLLLFHGGYLAAPFLHIASKRTLALWLTSPLAIIATLAIIVSAIIGARSTNDSHWIALGALIAVALYGAPIAALIWGR